MDIAAAAGTSHTALLESQRRVLERIARGASLAESMETLVRLIEQHAQDMRCAVLLADAAQDRLTFIAAPSIPEDYRTSMGPYLRIAPNMGSCGTAAYLRKPVYTEDTARDALWNACRDIAVRNGLRAIWSTPVLGDDNEVLGTFAMYYSEPRLPSPDHVQLIDMAVQMARVAIEAKRGQDALQRSEETLRRNRVLLMAEARRISQFLGTVLPADLDRIDNREETSASRGETHEAIAMGPPVSAARRKQRERQAIDSLTANERAILKLITEGNINAAVGELLHLSPRTVETYRARMMQKLQVEDLTALVKLAIRHGITSVD